jgi:hypothetical protein
MEESMERAIADLVAGHRIQPLEDVVPGALFFPPVCFVAAC